MTGDDAPRTQSGIPLRRIYRPQDASIDYDAQLGDPGTYPFTRGVRLADTTATWIQRELSGEGSPSTSNLQFRRLLDTGAQGLDIIGDTATMSCLDPDHPLARPAVGTAGVSLCRLQDFVDLYEGVPLDQISVSHSLFGPLALPALYLAAKAHGFDPGRLRGSMIQAPLFLEDCGYAVHLPTELRIRLTLDSIAFATREMPRFHPYLEDTYFISDGSLDAIDEMAFGFVQLRELTRRLLDRGLPVDRFGRRIAILVNCRMDLFEEIAKIRATRRMFARMMRDEFGATDPKTLAVNIAVHTSGMSLTSHQPINNVVRGAVQALAMAVAGVQGLEISTFDEGFRTPSHDAHVVALRTQQIIADETDVGRVADPLGGSWYVEALTDELERRILARITEIEGQGDVARLVDDGWFRAVFVASMEERNREVAQGDRTVVGVNRYRVPPDEDRLLRDVVEARFEPDLDHVERVVAWKAGRDQDAVARCLADLRDAAADQGADLMPPVLSALEGGVTFGEMTGALRQAVGRPADPLEVPV